MPVGTGQTVAWTSDVTNRWAVDWLRWPGYATFWAQVLRETMRQRRAGVEHPMRAEVVGGEVHVTVDAQAADDAFVNGLQSTLRIIDPSVPAGSSKQRASEAAAEVTLRQTGPGFYEARFPLAKAGTYLLQADHRNAEGRVVAQSRATVAAPYPAEYLTVDLDQALLDEAAALTGGTPQVDPTRVFEAADDEGVEYHRELWPYLVGLAIALMLLDLFLRRVRLLDRSFKSPARR
jgi:hypothetical protein